MASFPELQAILRKLWWGLKPCEKNPPQTYLTYLYQNPWGTVYEAVVLLLALPVVSAIPPLEERFHYSPRMKWLIGQTSCMAFVITLTAAPLALSGEGESFEKHPIRDTYLFLHALAGLGNELMEVVKGNIESYLCDTLNVFIELPAHVFTVAALFILVRHDTEYARDGTATSAREVYAIAVLLQWARLMRPLQMSEEFGPVVLMLGPRRDSRLGFLEGDGPLLQL
eukprot:3678616-Prymnesium_polylepis.1